MPKFEFTLIAILRELEDGLILAEAPGFPEVSRLGDDPEAVLDALAEEARRIVEADEPLERYRRRAIEAAEVGEVALTIEPAERSTAWREAVALRLAAVRWDRGEGGSIATVPALGIDVLGARREDLDRLLPIQARSTLRRLKAIALPRLVQVRRGEVVRVERRRFVAEVPSPRQAAQAAARGDVAGAARAPRGRDRPGGRPGRGRRRPRRRRRSAGRVADGSSAPERAPGRAGGGRQVGRRARAGAASVPVRARRDAVLVHERLATGRRHVGIRDVAGALPRPRPRGGALPGGRPPGPARRVDGGGQVREPGPGDRRVPPRPIARGELRAIAECTPEQLPVIERGDPHLLDAFTVLRVEEPPADEARAILRRVAERLRPGSRPPLSAEALATLDRLHRRYATYSVYPGRPLRFLTNLIHDHPAGDEAPIDADAVTRAFARETGLPLVLLDDATPLDLDAARGWFAARVIGQDEAVDLVVDLLATVKAGLARPGKPIASLMFIGPTGVGKTELAKALAEFLFGDGRRMTRFDMSEYADPISVLRLIGGATGRGEGLLTARVREQPFSVLLLDEFEKADPSFFDLLLQVLGEGRLTDVAGRLADFRNAVVIMTSNLGAEGYRRGRSGFARGRRDREEARAHFVREVQAMVRPELFNRIDRIVPFAPLDEATARGIVDRQLGLIARRDGFRSGLVRMSIAPEVPAALARRGHDPTYGARPLKRAIERELLAPLAERINRHATDAALDVDVTLDPDDRPRVAVRARLDDRGRQLFATSEGEAALFAGSCQDLRRRVQRLRRSAVTLEVFNEITRHRQAQQLRARKGKPPTFEYSARLAELTRVAGSIETLGREAEAIEDAAMLRLYGQADADPAAWRARREEAERAWSETLVALHRLQYPNPDRATLVLFAERPGFLFALAAAYREVATRGGGRVVVWQFVDEADDRPPKARRVERPGEFLASPRGGVVGIWLEFRWDDAHARLAPEPGLHRFHDHGRVDSCLVESTDLAVTAYRTPEGIGRPGSIDGNPRRVYRRDQRRVDEVDLDLRFDWTSPDLADALARVIEFRLKRSIEGLLDG